MTDKQYKMCTGAGIAFLVFLLNFVPISSSIGLPQRLYVKADETAVVKTGLPISATVSSNSESIMVNGEPVESGKTVDLSQPLEISAAETGEAKLDFTVAGLFKIRSMTVKVDGERKLIPGGQSIGVVLFTRGALVVSTGEVSTSENETVNPGELAGIQSGDVVLYAQGQEVVNTDHLEEIICGAADAVTLRILRQGEEIELSVQPVLDVNVGMYRLGLWMRDGTKGIGTMSYIDAESNSFGSLGHSITDVDTKDEMLLRNGKIKIADVVGIVKGEEGSPGELTGAFTSEDPPIGQIYRNTEFGIFGQMYEYMSNPRYPDGVEIGYQDEVHVGSAQLLTTIDETGLRAFDCEIIKVTNQRYPSSKSLVIKITDTELLERTGGIVQGMSGSPIIQDGKLIGAVTHVFVNDPQRGYGLFIEWMLSESDAISN